MIMTYRINSNLTPFPPPVTLEAGLAQATQGCMNKENGK